ncbi:MAG: CDP-alcohol phosphatidyltransferase family protein [bacterium]|nr:CDP-alcohol phosphatidyltransferase family protein [bacterium]
MDKAKLKQTSRKFLDPITGLLASLGLPPTAITVLGLVISIYGATVVARGSLFSGGLWLIVVGLCDVLDGQLARRQGAESKFGAFIDSTLDRIAELAYFGGIIVYYVTRPQGFGVFTIVLVLIALSGSFMISYTRARLEGLGYTCHVGWFERPERMIVLMLGLLLGSWALFFAMMVLALGSTITVGQRIYHGWKVTRADKAGSSEVPTSDVSENPQG